MYVESRKISNTMYSSYRFLITLIVVFLFTSCNENDAKPVRAGKQTTGSLDSVESDSIKAAILVKNPDIKEAQPTNIFMAPRNEAVKLQIVVQGVDSKSLSYAVQTKHKGVSVSSGMIQIAKLIEGDHSITVVGRNKTDCLKVHPKQDSYCTLNGSYLTTELRSYDLTTKFLIAGVDPNKVAADPDKNCTGSGGGVDIAKSVICQQGILGTLIGVLMPNGLGGLTNGLGSNGNNSSGSGANQ